VANPLPDGSDAGPSLRANGFKSGQLDVEDFARSVHVAHARERVPAQRTGFNAEQFCANSGGSSFILKPAVQTAEYAKYAKGKELSGKRRPPGG